MKPPAELMDPDRNENETVVVTVVRAGWIRDVEMSRWLAAWCAEVIAHRREAQAECDELERQRGMYWLSGFYVGIGGFAALTGAPMQGAFWLVLGMLFLPPVVRALGRLITRYHERHSH